MAKETGAEKGIPKGYRWEDLEAKPDLDRFEAYKHTLIHLGLIHLGHHSSRLVSEIFANANSFNH